MATYIVRDVAVYANQYDFSGSMNQAALSIEAEAKDVTTFRQTNRINKAGLQSSSLDMSGFVDMAEINSGAGDSVEKFQYLQIGLDTPIVTIAPDGVIEGSRAFLGQYTYVSYSPSGSVGDLFGFSVKASANSKMTRATVLNNALTPVTATGTTTKIVVGAISSTNQGVAHLHVVAFNGTSLDVVLESDANAGAGGETTRGTFTQATNVTSERITVAAPVTDTYWRLNYTFVGTSVTFLVAFGIEDLTSIAT